MHRSRPSLGQHPRGNSLRPTLRFFTLATLLALGLYFSIRLTRQPSIVEPLAAAVATQPRRTPFPDTEVLRGAVDREGFLVENEGLLLPQPKNERMRQDADARYHLLLLAATTPAEWLAADATTPLNHAQTLAEAPAIRGALCRVTGDLIAVAPLELKRDAVAGLQHAYQGVVTLADARERVLVLFTEWPKTWPPAKELSPQLPLKIELPGWFLKVGRVTSPSEAHAPLELPVVVGRLPRVLPTPPAPTADLPWVFAIMAGPVLLLLAGAWWWHRRLDRPYQARLAAARERLNEHERQQMESLENSNSSPEGVTIPVSMD